MYPILLQIGSVTIYSYGLFLAIAFLVGTFIIWQESRRKNLDEEKILDFILVSIGGGLFIGRIIYVLLNWDLFSSTLVSTMFFWQIPGFSGLGVGLGALIGGIWYLKKLRWPVLEIYNIAVLGLLLAQVFERIGLFFSGGMLGKVTNSFLGIQYPGQTVSRHPVALYEAVLYFIFFIILYYLCKKLQVQEKKKEGYFFNLYLVFWAMAQFGFSFFKENKMLVEKVDLTFIWPLTIILFSVGIYYYRMGRNINKDIVFLRDFFKRLFSSTKSSNNNMKDLVSTTKDLDQKE